MTGAAALAAFVPVAHAQQGTPTPAPAPRSTPNIITLPGADQFSLPASGAQPRRPVVQPTTQPTVRPTPAPSAVTPAVRATPTPRPAATGASRPPAAVPPTPTPAANPAAQATPPAEPVVEPTPAPSAVPIATPASAPVAAPSSIPWIWILAGAALASVLVALGWLLGRGRRAPEPVAVAQPRPASAPPLPAAVPPPPPAPRPAPRPALPAEPVMVELRPMAIALSDEGAVLDFELTVANATPAQIEGLRVAYGLMSASQIQDELIAAFHMTQLPPVADPFNLAPRSGVRIPGQLGLAPDKINIVDVGGRPMFVPLLMIDLRWRSGLSLKHQSSDFMVGMGGPGEKLGPIWLDKGAQRHERLNATRYFPKPVPVAAE